MQESVVLGGGCFWCLEAAFQLIEGVTSVVSGFAGGIESDPTYYDVAFGLTGHAEVVRLTYNVDKIALRDVLDIFWSLHDPTTRNQQGNDIGPQYRSIILYTDDTQLEVINNSIKSVQKVWDSPIVTEVERLAAFYPAEPEQQNYFKKHPDQAYCQIIINPKLKKLQDTFAKRLRKT